MNLAILQADQPGIILSAVAVERLNTGLDKGYWEDSKSDWKTWPPLSSEIFTKEAEPLRKTTGF
jgi:hypothetical protein